MSKVTGIKKGLKNGEIFVHTPFVEEAIRTKLNKIMPIPLEKNVIFDFEFSEGKFQGCKIKKG